MTQAFQKDIGLVPNCTEPKQLRAERRRSKPDATIG